MTDRIGFPIKNLENDRKRSPRQEASLFFPSSGERARVSSLEKSFFPPERRKKKSAREEIMTLTMIA